MNENSENISDLFSKKKLVKVCAPMVRYSKLPFRTLVRNYDADLCFTPMILADSFCQSDKARHNEFTTNNRDGPVVVQFAAKTADDFVGASYLVSPYANGVDLNCGCPQSWAKKQELGCAMLRNPDVIYDLVSQCRNRIPKPFTVSVKMRLTSDIKKTIEICRQLEKCHVSFLTVHARTPNQITGEINVDALKQIRDNVKVPLIANGGLDSLEDCYALQSQTNCDGVMVANGILTNPTIFSGSTVTTIDCIQNWLDICYNSTLTEDEFLRLSSSDSSTVPITIKEKPYNLTFQCFHHHLVFMLQKVLPRSQKRIFNNLQKFGDVLAFIDDYFHLRPRLYTQEEYYANSLVKTHYESSNHWRKCENINLDDFSSDHTSADDNGKYFNENLKENEIDCDLSNIFLTNL